jgi:hypothetical protein
MRRFLFSLVAFFALTPTAEAEWVWPVSGDVITPYRNGADPYATGQHRGIDIAAPVGATVVAAAGGEVRFAGTAGSSGLTISIRTGDGYDTSYLHLSSLAVRAGAHVSGGERIGAVGTTGVRSAAAPHLHFGVRDAGTRHDYHDPVAFLPPAPPPARTPEPPPPAPVTAPEPAPPAAAPVTVPHPAPNPHASPRRRPLGGPRRLPHAAPGRAPHAAPRRLPHAAPRRVPHAAPRRLARVAPAPRAAPRLGAVPAPQAVPRGAAAPPPTRRGSGPPSLARPRLGHLSHVLPAAGDSADRPDIGWIAVCAALLLAAGVLGVTGDAGKGTSKRVRALLRPLVVRR